MHTSKTNPLRKPGKTATGQDTHTNAQEEIYIYIYNIFQGKKTSPGKTIKESKHRCFNEEVGIQPMGLRIITRHKTAEGI